MEINTKDSQLGAMCNSKKSFAALVLVVTFLSGCHAIAYTIVHSASENLLAITNRGDLEKFKKMLSQVHDIHAVDNENNRPIHLAARGGHTEIVKLLLQAGAKVNEVKPSKSCSMLVQHR